MRNPGPLRVTLVNHHVREGGAARAVRRLYEALTEHVNEEEAAFAFRVVEDDHGDTPVVAGLPRGLARVRRQVSWQRARWRKNYRFSPAERFLHSDADVWTGMGAELDRSAADVVNLHWLGTGTLSIEEIGKIRKPIVWTFHDMWPFCGAEHYTLGNRFIHGYFPLNRPPGESGWDRNARAWRRKKVHWRRPLDVIAPSAWLAERIGESDLMNDWPISVIPNPLDITLWRPGDRAREKARWGFGGNTPVVLFVAAGGLANAAKGFDLLLAAFKRLGRDHRELGLQEMPILAVAGGKSEGSHVMEGVTLWELGHIGSDDDLVSLYRSVDAVAVPSRVDNLPQTATEPQACGTPVIGFRAGGLPDIVSDRVTGRLVTPFDPGDLAEGIAWVLRDTERNRRLGSAASAYAHERFSPQRVASQYLVAYRRAHARQSPTHSTG